MSTFSLNAISPIDGRYYSKTKSFSNYFSEQALIKYRVLVEIEYFIALCNSNILHLSNFPADKYSTLRGLYLNFKESDAQKVKNIESTTNHDVKAVEYFIKEEFDKLGLREFKEFIHFGLTSQDINNTAVPYSVKEAVNKVYLPKLNEIITLLKERADKWRTIPLLARTHGQAASPTRMGKEIMVFIERIENQLQLLETIPFSAKFGGATGNFNAHHVAYPNHNWKEFANNFVKNSLGLKRQQTTTQIEHYDNMAAIFHNLSRINTILIDFCKDIWHYISINYLIQKVNKKEIGSSAMPHKINPIDFENAEGNLMLANSLYTFFSEKLPISRLQRDLTDSTISRNIGLPLAYSKIAFDSIIKGINKLDIGKETIEKDLNNNWAVVSEAIQTILRREKISNPYELLKDLTRSNDKITKESISKFINDLPINQKIKDELSKIAPKNYIGNSNKK